MGLDSFKSSNKDDSKDEDGEEEVEETTTEEETEDEEEVTGIESFKRSSTVGNSTSDNDSDDENDSDEDKLKIPHAKLAGMPVDQRVEYIRQNHVEDYYPDYQPDGRWSYRTVIELCCVCDNVITFITEGVCMDCGRAYKDAGRTVIKKYDPHETEEDNEHTRE